MVVESGIAAFATWYCSRDRETSSGATTFGTNQIFANAPRELTRAVSLRQTLQLVRTTVDAVEQHAESLELPGDQRDVREAAVRYSRDVAFAAAEVYAHAAEMRGSWDSRLEALVMDTLLRENDPQALASLTAALGWREHPCGMVLAANEFPIAGPQESSYDGDIRSVAARLGCDVLIGLQGGMMLLLIAGDMDPEAVIAALEPRLPQGPVVVSATFTSMEQAANGARAARAGWVAARAWPHAPRPILADDLLPERVLAGDPQARAAMVDRIYRPLAEESTLLVTLDAYISCGRSLEATARALYVHTNTVRYRLKKVTDVVGLDPKDPRDSYVLHTATQVGRLGL